MRPSLIFSRKKLGLNPRRQVLYVGTYFNSYFAENMKIACHEVLTKSNSLQRKKDWYFLFLEALKSFWNFLFRKTMKESYSPRKDGAIPRFSRLEGFSLHSRTQTLPIWQIAWMSRVWTQERIYITFLVKLKSSIKKVHFSNFKFDYLVNCMLYCIGFVD